MYIIILALVSITQIANKFIVKDITIKMWWYVGTYEVIPLATLLIFNPDSTVITFV